MGEKKTQNNQVNLLPDDEKGIESQGTYIEKLEKELKEKQDKITVLYFNEDGYLLTPDHFKKVLTAMIVYAVKKDGDSPIEGGMLPLYNNNTHKLAEYNEDEWLTLTTTPDGDEVSITVDGNGISYARVMIIDIPLTLPIPQGE